MNTISNYLIQLMEWNRIKEVVIPVIIFVGSLAAFLFIRRFLWRKLKALGRSKGSRWTETTLNSLKAPANLFCTTLAISFTLQFAEASLRSNLSVAYSVKVALLLSTAWLIYRFIESLLYLNVAPFVFSDTTRTLLVNLARILILVTTGLVVLDNLGISITPILASLGVGSVAVALALQDTLSNYFSGFYLLVDEPIRIGDFIETESGIEGHVVKIGWRSTHIKKLSNNIVVIPNSKIASQRLTNFDLGETETAVLVEASVAYGSDLEKVQRVTSEVGKIIVSTVEGGVATFDPFIRFHTFNSSSIDFTVILRAQRITDQFLLKHEFIKALHQGYLKEGIEIPFPQRVVHLPASTVGGVGISRS